MPPISNRAAIADEYGELARQIAAVAPAVARAAELRREMESWFADDPAGEYRVEGSVYYVNLGACAVQRSISNMRKLYLALGVTQFLKKCAFPMSALDSLPINGGDFVSESRSGHRSIKPVLKAAAKAA